MSSEYPPPPSDYDRNGGSADGPSAASGPGGPREGNYGAPQSGQQGYPDPQYAPQPYGPTPYGAQPYPMQPYGPPVYGSQPGFGPTLPPYNTFAIVAICCVGGNLLFPPISGIAGLIFGFIGLKQINSGSVRGPERGKELAIVSLILNGLIVLGTLALIAVYIIFLVGIFASTGSV